MRKTSPAWQLGQRFKQRVLPAYLFFFFLISVPGLPQAGRSALAPGRDDHFSESAVNSRGSSPDSADSASQPWWQGLPVREIAFEGVSADLLKPLPGNLPQAVGAPLDRESIARSLRELYATGLFETVDADVSRQGDGVRLVFRGKPRQFIGAVSVIGAKGATINAQLQAASRHHLMRERPASPRPGLRPPSSACARRSQTTASMNQ